MLHLKEIPETNIVELMVDGKVSPEDFMVVTTILENKIQKQGKLRLLEEVKSFTGMPLKLWWQDIRFSLSHWNDVEKVAVVSDKMWAKLLTTAAIPLSKAEIKYFSHKDMRVAREWLHH